AAERPGRNYLGFSASAAGGGVVAALGALVTVLRLVLGEPNSKLVLLEAGVVNVALGAEVPFDAVTGALGVLGTTGSAGFSFPNCCMLRSSVEPECFTCCAFSTESKSVKTKKIPVVYLVILVRAVPVPAPNSASVAP